MSVRPPYKSPRAAGNAGGFALFAAIAILVILAALGAFVVSVTGLRDQSTALDLLGTRALHSAKAGVDWNMYLVQNPENTNPAIGPFNARYACPGTATNLNFGGVLSDFTVSVTCTTTAATESGNDLWIYQMVAVACNFPTGGACPNGASTSASYVERQVTALTGTCRQSTGASC